MSDDRKYIQESRNIGQNLKYLRNRRGLSLGKLSKELVIARGTLGHYECGYSKLSSERLEIMANFYGITEKEDLYMDHIKFIEKYGV